jgi:hypothetical protein
MMGSAGGIQTNLLCAGVCPWMGGAVDCSRRFFLRRSSVIRIRELRLGEGPKLWYLTRR